MPSVHIFSGGGVKGVAVNVNVIIETYEPAHDKTYKKTCATSENSDQSLHM